MTDPTHDDLASLASRYTVAWNSQDPSAVSACYAPDGSLTINDAPPARGRDAITAAARSFMTALPDMHLWMDTLAVGPDGTRYHWTFTGTNTGPAGTGNAVRISGHEEWTIGADGLIEQSLGHFDAAEYDRQIAQGYQG